MIDLRTIYLEQHLSWEDFTLDKLGHLNPRGHRIVAEVLAGSSWQLALSRDTLSNNER